MPPCIQRMPRLFIVTWLISWVLAVPLFHVHVPDVKDGSVFPSNGVAHTVFSPDLPGEFSQFSIARDRREGLDLSQLALNYPELGFVALNNNLPQDRKPGKRNALDPAYRLPESPSICCTSIEPLPFKERQISNGPPTPSRAPPFPVSI